LLLQVVGLSVRFPSEAGSVHAVDDVSLTVGEGEIIGIVGESGSGKSLFGLSLMGLLPKTCRVTQGTVTYSGKDLLSASRRELEALRGAELAMIFQNPRGALNPVFSVGNQVARVAEIHMGISHKAAKTLTLEMMQTTGIPNPSAKYRAFPHELSGGLCQRVMICMALICSPKLIIADEPTTALDVTIQAQILQLIEGLVRKLNSHCLFITHDLSVVAEICDRVAIMYAGEIVEVGSVASIFENPRHPYTVGLISSTLRVDRDLPIRMIAGALNPDRDGQDGCLFHPRCPYVRDCCRTGTVPVATVADEHWSRCHFANGGQFDAERYG
jgi:peptide/nickel transport system ATP-binding protein